jgi:hypothetical protein
MLYDGDIITAERVLSEGTAIDASGVVKVENLKGDTTYYVVAAARNANGEVLSNTLTMKTKGQGGNGGNDDNGGGNNDDNFELPDIEGVENIVITKTKDGRFVLFIGDGDLYRWERATGEYLLLYRAPIGCPLSNPSISYDEKYVLCYANQEGPWREKVTNGNENYGGFHENLYRLKKGYIYVIRMDGSGGDLVFEDTHRLGHTQWASDTNEYFAFCHEGPWNMVHQRIWIFNTVTRHVEACFRQYEDDCVGHEFWTQDGLMFFDNRGKGHDGTITSDRTQLLASDEDTVGAEAWIGFADKECNIIKKMDMPFYCNHYHCNGPHTLLVGDALDDAQRGCADDEVVRSLLLEIPRRYLVLVPIPITLDLDIEVIDVLEVAI